MIMDWRSLVRHLTPQGRYRSWCDSTVSRHLPSAELNHLPRLPACYLARFKGSSRPRPHMLRRAFVTTLLDAGVDPRDVQIAARHADPRTTMRYDRARQSLDRHPNYILAAYMASGTWTCARLAIAGDAYSIRCMVSLYEVEIEPEVRSWLAKLSDRAFGRVDFLVGLLAEHAEDLGEPYTRHLGGKVRELRFHLLRQQTRVTYWLAPGRRVILLTVFRKTRGAETAEVARALYAQNICEAGHSRAHEVFDREAN